MTTTAGTIDAYAVLGVRPDVSEAELKAAHRRLVRQHHPDLASPEDRATATRIVQDVNIAYGLVRDAQRRAAYDRLRRTNGLDARLAEQWEQRTREAGRWAGRWWQRNRAPLRRGAVRARRTGGSARSAGRRAGADALGRLLWLLSCAGGALGGLLLALALQRLSGADGPWTAAAGTFGGLLVGNQRGWHRRLRLAGHRPPATALWVGAALWAVAVAGGLWLDVAL